MLVYSLLLLVHLLCAVLWVGGMATMQFVVRPAAVASLEPAQRLPMMAETLRRFFGVVLVAIVLLLGSGFWMIEIAGGMAVVHRSVHLMLALGLVMSAIFGYLRWAVLPRLLRAVAAANGPEGARQLATIRSLVGINLGFGLLVFAVALLGRVLL